jgi:ribosomal protein S18 acetylase RimI-like enzyme
MSQTVDIRLMQPKDLNTLYRISRDAYSLNFGHHWEEGGLEEYMEKVFGREALAAELREPAIQYYVAFVNGEQGAFRPERPVAFMKLNLHSNLPGSDPEKGIELDKLYILPDNKGSGIGRLFMELAFRVAETLKKEVFWLAVIDTNEAAMAFYEKAGFQKHSTMRVSYPKFREELKGMWRMAKKLSKTV